MEKVAVNNKTKFAELLAVFTKTHKSNPQPEDVTALRQTLQSDTGKSLVREIGNLQNQVFHKILRQTAGDTIMEQETTRTYIDEMKANLGFEKATFMERMLIDEIVLRWLRLQGIEAHNSNAMSSQSLTSGIYWDKRLEMAQKQYLRALQTLGKVRKMIAQTQAKGAEMFKTLVEAEKQNNS